MEENSESQVEPVNRIRRKSKFYWLLGLSSFLILVVACLIFGASLVFSPMPEIPPMPLRLEDAPLHGRLIYRLGRELFRGKPVESELILTPEEVAALIRLTDNGFVLTSCFIRESGLAPRYYEVKYEERQFKFVVPWDSGWTFLFGGVIRFYVEATIRKEGDEISLTPYKFRAGRVGLPPQWASLYTSYYLESLQEDDLFILFNSAVRSVFDDDNGNLHIIYRPAVFRSVLSGK